MCSAAAQEQRREQARPQNVWVEQHSPGIILYQSTEGAGYEQSATAFSFRLTLLNYNMLQTQSQHFTAKINPKNRLKKQLHSEETHK